MAKLNSLDNQSERLAVQIIRKKITPKLALFTILFLPSKLSFWKHVRRTLTKVVLLFLAIFLLLHMS
jgi:hypothetical protein